MVGDRPLQPQRCKSVQPTQVRMTGLVMELGRVVGVRQIRPPTRRDFERATCSSRWRGPTWGPPDARATPAVAGGTARRVRRTAGCGSGAVQATPVLPASFQDGFSPGSPVGVECLGLAFHLTNVVREVVPDSPAAKAGLRPATNWLPPSLPRTASRMASRLSWSRRRLAGRCLALGDGRGGG